MFTIHGHVISPEQAAILLDDGLFRGVPAWGRVHDYTPVRPSIILDESVKVHTAVVFVLGGGEIQIRDETVLDNLARDIIWHFDVTAFERGLNLLAQDHHATFYEMLGIFRAGLDKATDLTQYGNAVIQLGLFGEVRY